MRAGGGCCGMPAHRLDEGDGVYFQATITFEDKRVQPNTAAVPVWSVEVDGDVMRFRDRPGSDGVTVPVSNIARIEIEPRSAKGRFLIG